MSVYARPSTLLFLLALSSGCAKTEALDLRDSGVTDTSVAAPVADAAPRPDAGNFPDAEPAPDAPRPSTPDASSRFISHRNRNGKRSRIRSAGVGSTASCDSWPSQPKSAIDGREPNR